MPTEPLTPDDKKNWPVCWLCKKPIKPHKVHYQAGQRQFPSHKNCLVTIKRSKDGGI